MNYYVYVSCAYYLVTMSIMYHVYIIYGATFASLKMPLHIQDVKQNLQICFKKFRLYIETHCFIGFILP